MPNALAFVKSTFPVKAMVPPKERGEMVLPDIDISPGWNKTPEDVENILVDGCHDTD